MFHLIKLVYLFFELIINLVYSDFALNIDCASADMRMQLGGRKQGIA